jgi:hypothetical protein
LTDIRDLIVDNLWNNSGAAEEADVTAEEGVTVAVVGMIAMMIAEETVTGVSTEINKAENPKFKKN